MKKTACTGVSRGGFRHVSVVRNTPEMLLTDGVQSSPCPELELQGRVGEDSWGFSTSLGVISNTQKEASL